MITNTLLAAETLPDLSEFDGLSVVDIAHNIINWPEGSEEQQRAIMAIRARAPGMGHNRPPLAEQLAIDLTGYEAKAAALVETAEQSLIIDDESAAKVNDLAKMVADLETELNTARLARTKPYRDAEALINKTYGAIVHRLNVARIGSDERGGLRAMITAYDDKKRADVEAARQTALAEQEERERLAREARQKADEARAADNGAGAVHADLAAMALEDRAETAATRAAAIRYEPVRSHLGVATRQRVITFTITHPLRALGWALKTPGLKTNVLDDFTKRVRSYLHSRAVGVAAVERGITIPGIEAKVELGQTSTRR